MIGSVCESDVLRERCSKHSNSFFFAFDTSLFQHFLMAATITSQRHDAPLVDLLRQRDGRRVDDLAKSLGITATAVRQRLDRLMKEGLVSREVIQGTRGRPSHSYNLTESGNRSAGDNFQDLAVVLWSEIRSVRDPAVRRGLLNRIGSSLADRFVSKVSGKTPSERLQSMANVMKDREIPCSFSIENGLPILTSLACPYPELAELDRGICAAERSMLETLSGGRVRLSECRLDGASCCRFTGVSSGDQRK